MIEVAVVGTGMTKFGKLTQMAPQDLSALAVKRALSETRNLQPKDIEGFFFSSQQPELLSKQANPMCAHAEYLGLKPKIASRVEGACSSGSQAIIMASLAIRAGMADVCLALGVEKEHQLATSDIMASFNYNFDRDWEGMLGVTAPSVFALFAQRHMHEYGTTEEQMAHVAVKNRRFGTKNPDAYLQKEVSTQEVLNSRPIARPLKLMDCSPLADGAAAAILARADEAKKYTDTPIYVRGMGQCLLPENLMSTYSSLTEWPATTLAVREVLGQAKISLKDVNFVELHDCYTIAEIMILEAMGFCNTGEGGRFVAEGCADIGGTVAVNTGGGLLSRGHPIGATGVCLAHIAAKQLRGEMPSGASVDDAAFGLTHNFGGQGTNVATIVYSR